MAPLTVDPAALESAGAKVVSTGEGLGSVVSTLTTALAGCDGMAGDDPAGGAFGRSYNKSASKLLEAMATTRNGLCRLGDGVRMSAHNYSVAEAMSNVSGHSQPLPVPHLTATISVGSAPSAVGNGVGAPAGWGWVAKYIGMIWPTGDPAKLRTAAAAWTSAGTNFEVSEITGAVGPIGTIGAQQIPEAPAIGAAFSDADRSAAGILQQCATIATQLTSLATKIDAVHAAILDLLSRICDPLTGLKEVWDILTGEDEDEIRKIANDIRTIVNQFTAEVDALRQQIATALTEATTILSTMGRYAEKGWDRFLHGTDVGRALDHVGQICDGVLTEAGGVIEGFWTLNPARAFVDPDGFWHSVDGAVGNLESLAGLDGEQSFTEAWKHLGKDVVHWDEWSQNPFKAAGESAFDLATVLLPGGALSKLPKLGRLGAGATKELKGLHPPEPRPTHSEPAPPRDKPAPREEPPQGGRPAPAPKPKPALAPYGSTESKGPVAQKPAAGAGPKPAVEPAPSRPGYGPPSEQHSTEPAPSAPAPAASGSHPGPSAPNAAREPAAPPATHLPGDQLMPSGAAPSKHPQQPYGGVLGAHLPQPPHDGARAHPADGGGPHQTDGGNDGHVGDNFAGPYQLPAPELVTSPPNGAFFWSGRTSDGIGIGPRSAGGDGSADSFAASHNGTTLEGLLEQKGVKAPLFDFTDTASQEWWSKVSGMYAENVRGEVHAVVGSNMRPGNVWETVELPRLIDNPAVTKIVVIDPETGLQTTIFER
jgi:hypothetical protein